MMSYYDEVTKNEIGGWLKEIFLQTIVQINVQNENKVGTRTAKCH